MVSVWDGIDKNVKFFTSSEGGLQGGMIPTSQKAEERPRQFICLQLNSSQLWHRLRKIEVRSNDFNLQYEPTL